MPAGHLRQQDDPQVCRAGLHRRRLRATVRTTQRGLETLQLRPECAAPGRGQPRRVAGVRRLLPGGAHDAADRRHRDRLRFPRVPEAGAGVRRDVDVAEGALAAPGLGGGDARLRHLGHGRPALRLGQCLGDRQWRVVLPGRRLHTGPGSRPAAQRDVLAASDRVRRRALLVQRPRALLQDRDECPRQLDPPRDQEGFRRSLRAQQPAGAHAGQDRSTTEEPPCVEGRYRLDPFGSAALHDRVQLRCHRGDAGVVVPRGRGARAARRRHPRQVGLPGRRHGHLRRGHPRFGVLPRRHRRRRVVH
mmetsp:Transcript_36556/g.94372  ORF Transcript_36556/g.94372 Transcript_36556/m.94372 type:complete len:304 (+) Transcript_36556:485-1396(+)